MKISAELKCWCLFVLRMFHFRTYFFSFQPFLFVHLVQLEMSIIKCRTICFGNSDEFFQITFLTELFIFCLGMMYLLFKRFLFDA